MTHLNAMVIIRDRTAAASGLDESKKGDHGTQDDITIYFWNLRENVVAMRGFSFCAFRSLAIHMIGIYGNMNEKGASLKH